jgi:hypothetical protein
VSTHSGAADPHGDRAFATAAIATHAAAADPHPTYLTQAEGDALYQALSTLAESIDDRVAALLVQGTNVTLTYNDAAGTITIDAAGGGGGSGLTQPEVLARSLGC